MKCTPHPKHHDYHICPNISYKKKQWRPPSKKKKRGWKKPKPEQEQEGMPDRASALPS
jgi:hypothetical protein